jgi:hypothetical protein
VHPGAFLSRYCSIKIEASLSACPACVLRLCSIHRVVFLVRRLMSLAERRCSLFASRRYRERDASSFRVLRIFCLPLLSQGVYFMYTERERKCMRGRINGERNPLLSRTLGNYSQMRTISPAGSQAGADCR